MSKVPQGSPEKSANLSNNEIHVINEDETKDKFAKDFNPFMTNDTNHEGSGRQINTEQKGENNEITI